MKNIKLYVATLGVLLTSSLGAMAAVEHAAAAQPCVVHKAIGFTVNADNTITGSFTVSGDAGCTQPVTLETWIVDPSTEWKSNFYSSQVLSDMVTQNFGVGMHSITAKLPLCESDNKTVRSFQADIVASANPPSTIETPGFYWTNQADGTSVIPDARLVNNVCPVPVVTPVVTPVTPTATPVAITTAAQPTQLVNTGPGDIVALFAIATIGGAFAHRKLASKRA